MCNSLAPASVETKSLIVILMGPPGAGKGTHANSLSKELRLPHISTGDLFREYIRKQTPFGQKAKHFIDQGKLVPDDLVLDMLFERIGHSDCKNGYLLDLHFAVEDTVLVERITGRLACKHCNRPHHIKFDPPKKHGHCNDCAGPLYQRDDDRE